MEDTLDALQAKGMTEAEAYKAILDMGAVPMSYLWETYGIENPVKAVAKASAA